MSIHHPTTPPPDPIAPPDMPAGYRQVPPPPDPILHPVSIHGQMPPHLRDVYRPAPTDTSHTDFYPGMPFSWRAFMVTWIVVAMIGLTVMIFYAVVK